MRTRYRISQAGPQHLTDAQVDSHRDARRLLYNYHRGVSALHKKPLYKDRRAFIALLIIVLLAILVSEAMEKDQNTQSPPPEQQH